MTKDKSIDENLSENTIEFSKDDDESDKNSQDNEENETDATNKVVDETVPESATNRISTSNVPVYDQQFSEVSVDNAKQWTIMPEMEKRGYQRLAQQKKLQGVNPAGQIKNKVSMKSKTNRRTRSETVKNSSNRRNTKKTEMSDRNGNSSSGKIDHHHQQAGIITSNPFLNFLRYYRRNKNKVRSTVIAVGGAKQWNSMPEKEKLVYRELAKQQKQAKHKDVLKRNKTSLKPKVGTTKQSRRRKQTTIGIGKK